MEPENKNQINEAPEVPTQTPPAEPQPRPIITEDKKEGSVGPVIASIIIIVLIIIAGLYFWGSILEDRGFAPENQIDPGSDTQVEELGVQGSSDEVGDIEADLNSTDIDSSDDGLNDIDQAF